MVSSSHSHLAINFTFMLYLNDKDTSAQPNIEKNEVHVELLYIYIFIAAG